MGTNFYIRRVKPRVVHDEMHIAKRSWGWVIHFQDSTAGWQHTYPDYEDRPPSFRSVREIRALLETGEYQLADEYDNTWEPGEESLNEFDELCRWRGGDKWEDNPVNYNYPDGDPPYQSVLRDSYEDVDGFSFTSADFL